MTLYQSVKGNVSDLAIKIRKVLKERQSCWNADQKKFLLKRIKEKQLKSEKSKDYFKNLLQTFRSWRFPWRIPEDLHSTLLASPDIQERLSKQTQNSYVSLARFI